MMLLLQQFLFGFGASFGFANLFKCPKKQMALSCLTSGIGWVVYYIAFHSLGYSLVVSTFFASLIISFFSEVFARVRKDAVTIFAIPALLPLVPGGSLYYALLYFINGDNPLAALKAIDTIGGACSIAIAMLLVSSISKYLFKLKIIKR